MSRTYKYYGPAIWWALLILVFCSISFGSIGRSHFFFPGFDKLTHCGLFFVLTTLIGCGCIMFKGERNFTLISALKVFLIALSYGALIEVLQLYVFTWRSGEWADLFCDGVGSAMGIFTTLVTLYATANAKN